MTLEEEYELSCYKELTELCDGKESYIVKNINDGKIYVKKKVKLCKNIRKNSLNVKNKNKNLQIKQLKHIKIYSN